MNKSALGMILKGYPRISETFISNEIYLLEQRGIRVHIFSMRHPREAFTHESVKKIKAGVDYLPHTLLRPLPKLLKHNCRLALKNPKRYRQTLKTAFKRFLRTRKAATIKHLFQAGYLVDHLLPQSGVTHLHAHFAHSPTSVAFFASRLSGLPFSFTAHAKDIYTSNKEQLREKITNAKFVVTCTKYNQTYLKKIAGDSKTPIEHVYHGIDTKLFKNESISINPTPPYHILTVARLAPKKGIPTVLKAIKILKDTNLPIHYTLIGDGDDRKRILNQIKQLSIDSLTTWHGTLPHEKVLAHYRKAGLFVIGCQIAPNGDRDGIPNVIVESMAMGVPVVATTVSAIPEIIENGLTGLLVPPHDPRQMAQAMQRLLTEPHLREQVITAAKTKIQQKFQNRHLIAPLAGLFTDSLISQDKKIDPGNDLG